MGLYNDQDDGAVSCEVSLMEGHMQTLSGAVPQGHLAIHLTLTNTVTVSHASMAYTTERPHPSAAGPCMSEVCIAA